MNFKDFYINTEHRITETILSLWAYGDVEMQTYLKKILKEEKLLASPVFQNMFPWESSDVTFGELTNIFDSKFIKKLDSIKDQEYQFPANRKPYLHQLKSWQASLERKKSILVTTGTGSGKTECFMLPVLQDIYTANNNGSGVNAIFLYPLNALIGSQKKRIHAWCEALGSINYAVYNGRTPEHFRASEQKKAFPEIISREGIRQSPPHILFTNPTMLEYMLVRDKDTELLEKSQGTLRWILLDEAHTLTGSKAVEMALLIRRVIDAFGVDIRNVRFALTSATVGIGKEDVLRQFMSDLCGINTSQIEIITGKRTLPETDIIELQNSTVDVNGAIELRSKLYQTVCLDMDDINKIVKKDDLPEQLSLIDELADSTNRGEPFLPLRGHFFVRNINGIYACTNPDCNRAKKIPRQLIGSITTVSKLQCECGNPLLELISCRNCNEFMMKGLRSSDGHVKQTINNNDVFFDVGSEDDNEVGDGESEKKVSVKFQDIIIARRREDKDFITDNISPIKINSDGSLIQDPTSFLYEIFETGICPCCGESIEHPFYFRLSAAFLNRIMSDVILEQTESAKTINEDMLWEGKKYIAFTDSRQGTAKISALTNIESERFWLRSFIYHKLCEKRKELTGGQLSTEERSIIENNILDYEKALLVNQLPIIIDDIKNKILEKKKQLNNTPASVHESRISWKEMLENGEVFQDFRKLFNHNIGGSLELDGKDYFTSLLYYEFARRLPRERSLENLGLVNLTYKGLDKLLRPQIAEDFNINEQEWKNLVKISLDYIIRSQFHYLISPAVNGLSTRRHFSNAIYPSGTLVENVTEWPVFEKKRSRHNRLALLICAGLGYHETHMIDSTIESQINDLMISLWNTVKVFLTPEQAGYKLKFEEKAEFELAESMWLCPVKKRLIDTTFKGYSPWIKGKLSGSNINSYLVGDPIRFPYFPHPFNRDVSNNKDTELASNWINSDKNIAEFQRRGFWTSLHERIILNKPLYLAGEHSAQQKDNRLKLLEKKFQYGSLNILSCSTTMEMGVDIGGISAVVMSNVPSSPANYMQRTGRAGRRREKKSLAFTICASNPIGNNVITNPKWALVHPIAAPMLTFNSKAVVQKHINAFLFGVYIRGRLGINVLEKIESFFLVNQGQSEPLSENYLAWLLSEDTLVFIDSIKKLVKKTPFENATYSSIFKNVYSCFEEINTTVKVRLDNYNSALSRFLQTKGYSENSPAFKAVNFQKRQFLNKNLLTFLSEEGYLPAGGIPTGVVDFNNSYASDINNKSKESDQFPSLHLTRALSEYAPGNEVVIDGWTYVSEGIELKNKLGNETEKSILQHCTCCGFEQILNGSEEEIPKICPHCENDKLAGIKGIKEKKGYSEVIEPSGFAVDLFKSRSREIKETSNAQYVEPLLINVEPWSNPSHPVFEFRDSKENAEILYYNHGKGFGYSVCLDCGKSMPHLSENDADLLKDHDRLRGGKDEKVNSSYCSGNDNKFAIRENVLLIGRYQTDFFELRCKDINGKLINDQTTLYSLGQALSKSLTSYLGIEEQEVDFGVKKYDGFTSVFLFDTAKGGAGYVSQCANYFEEICKEALESLNNCDCTSACTKCLIDRRTQYHLDKLNKDVAKKWLQRVLNLEIEEDILSALPTAKKLLGTLKYEWSRLLEKKQLKNAWLFVDNNEIDKWNTTDFRLLSELKLKGIGLDFVFRGQPNELSIQQKLTLLQVQSIGGILYTDVFNKGRLQLIGRIELNSGQLFDYYSKNYHTILDEHWGSVKEDFVYKQEANIKLNLNSYLLKLDEKQEDIFEVKIKAPSDYIKSSELFKEFYNCLPKAHPRLGNTLKGKKLTIKYSDQYLINPFGCALLLQFLSEMKKHLDFEIIGLEIHVKEIKNKYGEVGDSIMDQFEDNYLRKEFIERMANELGISSVSIHDTQKIDHYRFLTLTSDNKEIITIRPEAGIAHGWFPKRRVTYSESYGVNDILEIQQKVNKDLLYTLVFN